MTSPSEARTDQVLQEDINNTGVSPQSSYGRPIGLMLQSWEPSLAQPGKSYVVFTSADRGGTCLSAIFAFNQKTDTATFMFNADVLGAPTDEIHMPGVTYLIPHTISLASLKQNLNPTGGTVFPVDASEGTCPGP